MSAARQVSGKNDLTRVSFEQPATLDVSIIIVSWNAKDYLRKCLKSLAQPTSLASMEIIVVDNASSDGSSEMVASEFPSVRLIHSGGNLGFAKANNIGMRLSRGRYLGLVNSDVEVLDDCLSRLIEGMDNHPRIGMSGPFVFGGDGKIQRSCRGFPGVWNMFCRCLALDHIFPSCRLFNGYQLLHWKQDSERAVDILSGCFWLARREAVEQVGGLDEGFFMYGEDMDWCRRFHNAGWELRFLPSARAIHYGGASSANAPLRFFVEKQRADLQYWAKHHSIPARLAYWVISLTHHAIRALGQTAGGLARKGARGDVWFKARRSVACVRLLLTRLWASPKLKSQANS